MNSNIKWIGNEDNYSIFRALLNLIEYGTHNLSISAGEFKSIRSFAWTNWRTCTDDDDISTLTVIIVTIMDFDIGAVDTCSCMAGISCLTPSLIFVEVNENDFRCKLEISNLVNNSGTNIGSTDDNDLSAIIHYLNPPYQTN